METCKTCEYFQPAYKAAINAYGEGYGLCGSHKLRRHIPGTSGLYEPTVHEDFGCVDHYGCPTVNNHWPINKKGD